MASARRRTKYSRGRWMIERERCGIPAGTPQPAEDICTDLESGLQEVLKGLGLAEMQWSSQLVEKWHEIVGSQVAVHTRPGRMYGAELIVYVDSPVWLHELSRYGLKGMHAKVQAYCGHTRVKGIRLQLDPDGASKKMS